MFYECKSSSATAVSSPLLVSLLTEATPLRRVCDLRYVATLLGLCFAAFLAVTAGLLLQRPLPALPFIATAFVVVNADLIVTSLVKRR
jgi:hypothetical protein